MNKKVFAAMTVVAAMFAGYITYDMPNEGELSKIILTNVEALANEGEGSKVYDFWCCGNTCTCAKGEGIEVHGHLSRKPCQ